MIQSITQYDLMSTSTCTPLGGGASQCVYQYRKEISTTTQNMATSTANYEAVATVGILFVIGMTVAIVVGTLVRKFT